MIEAYEAGSPSKKVYTYLVVTVIRNIFAPEVQAREVTIFDYHDPRVPVVMVDAQDRDGVRIFIFLLYSFFHLILLQFVLFWGL